MRRAIVGYPALFLLLAAPWLWHAGDAIPSGADLVSAGDARLIAWVLGWEAHALVTRPTAWFDAPVYHPAPGQLTGSEHFASSQLVFAPVFWPTGNAVLAANAVAFLSYPLAALAMERLLAGLGCGPGAAWVAGLAFALGPLRVPANLQVLQYLNLYLPLVALALTRLRAAPRAAGAAGLAGVLVLAFLSSYYMAVMAVMSGSLWAMAELSRAREGRLRFVLLAVAAGSLAVLVLVLVSLPYLARPERADLNMQAALADPRVVTFHVHAALLLAGSMGIVPLAAAASGLAALRDGTTGAGIAARRGLVLLALAVLLMLGPRQPLGGVWIPLPFAALAASPARFFRLPWRFVVVAGFGLALLAGAGLDVLRRRLGRGAGGAVLAAVAVALVVTRGLALSGAALDRFVGETRPIDDVVAREAQAAGDDGTLLELPLARADGRWTETEAMVGATRHWLPLVEGLTGYPPAHDRLVHDTVLRLPADDALQDLVDMTHLRWLVLWPDPPLQAEPVLRGVAALPGVQRVAVADGWQLLRVDRVRGHPEWYEALAGGPRAGMTLLGTPLRPLTEDEADGRVRLGAPPGEVVAGGLVQLVVRLENAGRLAWPVALPPNAPGTYAVWLVARWTSLDGRAASAPQAVALRRDVPAGESLLQPLWLAAPPAPGTYALEARLHQAEGATFQGPGNAPLRIRLAVAPGRD